MERKESYSKYGIDLVNSDDGEDIDSFMCDTIKLPFSLLDAV